MYLEVCMEKLISIIAPHGGRESKKHFQLEEHKNELEIFHRERVAFTAAK